MFLFLHNVATYAAHYGGLKGPCIVI